MKKILIITFLLAFVLAACSGQTVSTSDAPVAELTAVQEQPTSAPAEPTNLPARTEPTNLPEPTNAAVEPTSEPSQPAASGGAVIYKIVPGESIVSYEVGETFLSDNRFNLAIGRTPQISGEVTLDPSNPQNSTISPLEIDISQFQSDSSRRDRAIRDRFLESGRFPIASFTPSSITGLPASYNPGEELVFQVMGDLKVKETTKPVTFDVTAKLDGETLTGTAVTTILLSDFGVGPIEIAGMLGTEDQAKLILTFIARP